MVFEAKSDSDMARSGGRVASNWSWGEQAGYDPAEDRLYIVDDVYKGSGDYDLRIEKFTPSLDRLWTVDDDSQMDDLKAVKPGPGSLLYMAGGMGATARLAAVNKSDGSYAWDIEFDSTYAGDDCLAVTNTDELYLTAGSNTSIKHYDNTGTLVNSVAVSGASWLSAIAVDDNSNVFVSSDGTIYKYASDLTLSWSVTAANATNILALSVDQNGTVYGTGGNFDIAVDSSGTILWENEVMTNTSEIIATPDGSYYRPDGRYPYEGVGKYSTADGSELYIILTDRDIDRFPVG